MQYRNIGNTGMRAGIIGLGAEHLDGKDEKVVINTIHAAQEGGMNVMDVFMPGDEIRAHIGKAIKGRREDWLLQGHIGSTDINQQYDISRDLAACKRYFEKLLVQLDTDYIDMGMLFFIDREQDYKGIYDNGIVDYVMDLKRQGIIRHIGASAHNPQYARKLVEDGVVEMLMFSVNPAFDMTPPDKDPLASLDDTFNQAPMVGIEPSRAKLYSLCAQKGVGITTMKTLGAGKLLAAEHSPFAKALTAPQCIHYALSRPAVASTLIGCASPEEVAGVLEYFALSDEQLDYTAVIQDYQTDFTGHCVYCNHCLPCPADINIAEVNRYLDIALLDTQNIPPSVRQHYTSLGAGGSNCIACGQCETRCPFSVPVVERMQKASEVFGTP